MQHVYYLIVLLLFSSAPLFAQLTKDQLVGTIVDIANNEGLEGVKVQLINTNSIKYTDAEGKFKFESQKGFLVGEPNYSFLISKKGYISTGSTNNKVVFGSGAIENMTMKKDLEKFLWITVMDGKTGNLIQNAKIDIKGKTKETNDFGKTSYDFSDYEETKIKTVIRKDCYKDEIAELPSKGEIIVKMIPICETNKQMPSRTIDIDNAPQLLDRALKTRNGSKQGQVEAIEFLLTNDYSFNGTDFSGVNLEGIQFQNTDLAQSLFNFSFLDQGNFNGTSLYKTRWNFATANGLQMAKGTFTSARAAYLKAKNANFKGADLSGSFFFGCDFSGSDFTDAKLHGTVFAYCTLNGAVFDKSNLLNTGFTGSIMNGTSFKEAEIENVEVRGVSVTDGTIPFTAEQLSGLCKNPGYGRVVFNRGIYHFKLVAVSEHIAPGDGKYNTEFEKQYHFGNFTGTTFNPCNKDFEVGGDIKNDAFEWTGVYESDTFLSGSRRIEYARNTVNDHFKAIQSYLYPQYTLKNKDSIQKWERKVTKKMLKKIGDRPALTTDITLMLLLKYEILKDEDIEWRKMAANHLGQNSASLGYSKKDEKEYRNDAQFLFPFNITYFDLPENWDSYYEQWVKANAKTKIDQIMTNLFTTYPTLTENGDLEFTFAKGSSLYRSLERPLADKGLSADNVLLMERNMVTDNFRLLLVLPNATSKAVLHLAQKINPADMKKGIHFRSTIQLKNIETMTFEETKYVLVHAQPVDIQYKVAKGNWAKAEKFEFIEK